MKSKKRSPIEFSQVVALASPSAAQAWFDSVVNDFLLPANTVAAACIGETTAKRMRKLGSDRCDDQSSTSLYICGYILDTLCLILYS